MNAVQAVPCSMWVNGWPSSRPGGTSEEVSAPGEVSSGRGKHSCVSFGEGVAKALMAYD